MNIARAVSWNDSKRRRKPGAPLALALAFALLGTPALGVRSHGSEDGPIVSVIVQARSGSESAAQAAVREAGGSIGSRLGIINGFVAGLPASRIDGLSRLPEILAVTHNRALKPHHSVDGYAADTNVDSMYNVTLATGAQDFWNAGFTGKGVGVALIDSGVSPVTGLSSSDKIVNGPDLSFESQSADRRYLDTFGHGSHMAGIIGGRDSTTTPYAGRHDTFLGMAPDAKIVSLKVADAHGSADVSQVIAAIDWVVRNKNINDMNIKVLNLSWGTDSTQSYLVDPLAHAVEVAWRSGVVVVAAAGNHGATRGILTNPASDPYVVAVGASDTKGTVSTSNDVVASFSARSLTRSPDLLAPGVHVQSLRVPGSYIDQTFSGTGRINTRFFKGSGTSQAAAVVSGAAALLMEKYPEATPDQIKKLLTTGNVKLPLVPTSDQGSGILDLSSALSGKLSRTKQNFTQSTGVGSLHLSRGTNIVVQDGVSLIGEKDIFGDAIDTVALAALTESKQVWVGGSFNGRAWTGDSFSGNSWSAISWSGNSWSGNSWSGITWSGNTWSGNSWSGNSWSGITWSGNSWSGNSWSGVQWN